MPHQPALVRNDGFLTVPFVLFQNKFAIPVVHGNGGAGGDAAFQKLFAQHGFHGVLHIAAQGTGTEFRIVPFVYNVLLGGIRQAAGDLLRFQTLVQLGNLQVDDLGDVVLGQGLIEDNLVQTVQELRAAEAP